MRDIKFRAWDKENNRWFDLDEFRVNGHGDVYFTDHDRPEHWGDWGEKYETTQYTGLKDKNGVEIYEGDIITTYSEFLREEVGHTIVGWERAGFIIPDERYIRVIGNIYENKELLDKS